MTLNDRYVEIVNLVKAYPNPLGDPVCVVDRFNLVIKQGEIISVIGHSGCGKSTVLTMVAGLNPITSGDVVVEGKVVDGPGPDRAVVFQAPCLLPWMTAFGNVMIGVKRVYAHATKQEQKEIVEYYLSLVGLSDAMHKYPREMSGGMQQRVGIARAIALKPRVLLLDEPFGRLDSLTRMDLQNEILNILDKEKITTMLVTHDVDEAVYMSDRICMMTNGPRARVGQILEIPFERPRNRREVIDHEMYYDLRGCLIDFLNKYDIHAPSKKKEQQDSNDQATDLDKEDANLEYEELSESDTPLTLVEAGSS